MADSLAALGLELRAEAVAWLAELTPAALPDGTQAARELFTALGALEAEVADAAADQVELTRLQAWLTAGFYAAPEPFAPADAVVAEVTEQARRGEADGGSADTRSAGGSGAGSAAGSAGSTGGPGGANEFAAGNSQSPPSRTASREMASPIQPRRDAIAAGAFQAQQPSAPSRPKQRTMSELFGNDPIDSGHDRAADSGEGLPRPAGGIQGLSALAALAGRGIEIPDAREDADRPQDASDRAAWEPEVGKRTAGSVDADRADAIDRPVRSASPAEPPVVREVDRDAVRIVRIPFAPRVVVDADEAWAPLPIPFLASPGQPEDAAPRGSAPAPGSEPRPPIAIPTMRVFDGLPTQPAPERQADAAEWAGFGEPAESTESFLERAARLAGARVRPAAEVVAAPAPSIAAPREEFAPAAQPLARLAAAEPEVTPTVLAREVEAPRPVDSIEWPAADVTDLLDALASEIAHEYRRYYGE